MNRFGMPNWVIMDLGSPFTTMEFRSWAQDCGISIDYASVAHLQANGQVESQWPHFSRTQAKVIWRS
jgi:transposase InsO family protein